MAAITNPLPLLPRRQFTSRVSDPAMNAHTALPPRHLHLSPGRRAAENGTSPTTVNGNVNANIFKPTSPSHTPGKRVVKKLRRSKGITIPDGMTVYDACHRMVAHRVDALLPTDGNGLLVGIATDKTKYCWTRRNCESYFIVVGDTRSAAHCVDMKLLASLDEELRKRVISEEKVVSAISRAVKRSRVGLKDPPTDLLLQCSSVAQLESVKLS